MALQVPVHREVRDYEARILGGLSWRQLATVAALAPLVVGILAVGWKYELDDVATVLVVVVSIPAGAIGWWKPMGLAAEVYAGYVLAFWRGGRVLVLGGVRDGVCRARELSRGQVQELECV